MPAAAVIPAPIAYIKVVAVKKLVVEFRVRPDGPPIWRVYCLLRVFFSSSGLLGMRAIYCCRAFTSWTGAVCSSLSGCLFFWPGLLL